MKTTLDIPDALLRQAKARAATRGTSMRDFFVLAIEDRLDAERKGLRSIRGWQAVFGKAPPGSGAAVQATLDQEFEKVNPEDWK
jgi:hypothetical protein